ncbi:PREDICTED: ATPase family AAA domain-containing protein 1-A-like [Cyprinodon variegatus]|uniref:ATPase family AAA domain-containing protein 1-A-like n=1 Tax=Cyprinodon variegatus TaxID=28743 RepID=UPI00074264F5|nr:PREDICTED: ATPase family AAA domain-containing protein 1-A-like [Cyprinodon variegatus]
MLLKDLPREALMRPLSRNEVIGMLVRLSIFGAATYYSIKWVVDAMDPTSKQKSQAKKRAEELMRRIGVEGVKLTEYEMNIASLLVDPQTIKVSWRDIAGLDDIINELQDTVILPFQKRHLLPESKLFQPPKGLWSTTEQQKRAVSYGPGPGTPAEGGRSQRGQSEQTRPSDGSLDTGGTNTRQREDILRLVLAGENLSNAINLKEIAEKTEGYSGSDLRELCRDAAMYRVRDYVRKEQMRQIAQQLQDYEEEERPVDEDRLRPVTQLDLLFGLDKMKESKQATSVILPRVAEVPLD